MAGSSAVGGASVGQWTSESASPGVASPYRPRGRPGPRHRHGQRVVARRGGALGPTRPASVGHHPQRAAQPATGAQPRQRGHHPGARPRRARGRGRRRSAARSSRRRAPSSRSSRCWSARSAPGSRPTRRPPRASAASSSSASTGSPRSWPRPPPATPRCSRCSPRTPSSPTPPASSSARCSTRAGEEVPEEEDGPEPVAPAPTAERRVVPQSVISRQLANPFLAPDFSGAAPRTPGPRRLATWELLGPLFRSFEHGGGARRAWTLPEPTSAARPPGGLRADAAPGPGRSPPPQAGHRTFLLADEPGLGKTAQALLAAQAADAYPLLVVVPNVVKTNWAREAELWTPRHPATVIHGDGDDDRRLRRHRRRQLRGARPPRRLARRPRLPRHGRRRGALHQEQDVAALPARARSSPSGSAPAARARC